MNIENYLLRIGYAGSSKPTLDTLKNLIECHLEQVPFENLECFHSPQILSLQPEDLYEKIVLRKRGGMCFELNGLFLWLLKRLGFDAHPILVRIQMGSKKLEPISHQANIVTLNEKRFYCDVGFGGPAPKGLVALDTEEIQSIAGEQYRVVLKGCQYEIQWYHEQRWQVWFSFVGIPAAQEDFKILMYYFSTNPQSEFVRSRLVNLCLPDGSLALTDNQFTARRNGQVSRMTLNSEQEIAEVLRQQFHLIRAR